MEYLKTISDTIDKHRAEAMICCPEDCWCWGAEAAICGHSEEPLNKVNASNQLIFCRHCGRELESWQNHCTGCANKVDH